MRFFNIFIFTLFLSSCCAFRECPPPLRLYPLPESTTPRAVANRNLAFFLTGPLANENKQYQIREESDCQDTSPLSRNIQELTMFKLAQQRNIKNEISTPDDQIDFYLCTRTVQQDGKPYLKITLRNAKTDKEFTRYEKLAEPKTVQTKPEGVES
ncbi:MAG: hypothetical protein MK193_09460 [Lentisphaeria bacterium]|nr:hypothetical protein [Lentisphaeria bacterium]